MRADWCGVAILLLSLMAWGCDTQTVLQSPSKHRQIKVARGASLSSRIRIYLADGWIERRVFTSRGEAFFDFAEAAWSADEKTVGVVVNGTELFTLAFDVAILRSLDEPEPKGTTDGHG